MNVRPTNSGTIVQARAHVLIGSFEPVCCEAWTFLKTLKSTNGPFLLERLMASFQFSVFGFQSFDYFNFKMPYRRDLRRRTIALFDALRRLRVKPPFAG